MDSKQKLEISDSLRNKYEVVHETVQLAMDNNLYNTVDLTKTFKFIFGVKS